ncbi:class I SAM-dependent methyltransferase [Vallitalea sediminicola]
MSFYESISKSYDNIFPMKESMVNYVLGSISEYSTCKLLDIGCATGHMAGTIGEKGVKVVGIDLNSEMIKYAASNFKNDNISFQVMNMLKIEHSFESNSFDIVTCFGNTLVHLTNEEEIFNAIRNMKAVLKVNGKILIQILNYQFILDKCIKELPIIENEYIKFERFYSEQIRDERLIFETRLTIKDTGEIISNEIYLYPLLKKQLISYLEQLGFHNIKFYKNFNREPASYNHLPLVVEALAGE